MRSIAFIDNFIETPINHCVNDFILRNQMPCTYHQPARFGFDSLNSLNQIDGIVILGSASHVSENASWHKELLDFIVPYIEKGIPTLGVCFGHQLLASHYGCEVDFIDREQTNLTELRKIVFTQDFGSIQTFDKMLMPYAHQQIVKSISSEFEVIMKSDQFSYEGLKHLKYKLWTFQGHPESSEKFIEDSLGITSADERALIKSICNNLMDEFAQIVLSY